jgi:hypothetical protein
MLVGIGVLVRKLDAEVGFCDDAEFVCGLDADSGILEFKKEESILRKLFKTGATVVPLVLVICFFICAVFIRPIINTKMAVLAIALR